MMTLHLYLVSIVLVLTQVILCAYSLILSRHKIELYLNYDYEKTNLLSITIYHSVSKAIISYTVRIEYESSYFIMITLFLEGVNLFRSSRKDVLPGCMVAYNRCVRNITKKISVRIFFALNNIIYVYFLTFFF